VTAELLLSPLKADPVIDACGGCDIAGRVGRGELPEIETVWVLLKRSSVEEFWTVALAPSIFRWD
jgi:hypothetical protein